MDRGLEWYKHCPRDFLNGVQGLGPELIGAYIVLLDLMYERGGSSPRDDRHLGGILGCSSRKARSLTNQLIEKGKILEDCGDLTNRRVQIEAKSNREYRESKSNAGRKGAEVRWKSNENNSIEMAVPSSDHHADKKRLKKTGGGGSAHSIRNSVVDDRSHPTSSSIGQSDSTDDSISRLIKEAAGAANLSEQAESWSDQSVEAQIRDWMEEFEVSVEEIVEVIHRVASRHTGEPIQSPQYFKNAIERMANGMKNPGTIDRTSAVNNQRLAKTSTLRGANNSKDIVTSALLRGREAREE